MSGCCRGSSPLLVIIIIIIIMMVMIMMIMMIATGWSEEVLGEASGRGIVVTSDKTPL